jgi:hypothetical protein
MLFTPAGFEDARRANARYTDPLIFPHCTFVCTASARLAGRGRKLGLEP